MYQCNCKKLFNSPEERTVHMVSCPVMVDKTPMSDKAREAQRAGVRLAEALIKKTQPLWDKVARTMSDACNRCEREAIEKGRQMERERITTILKRDYPAIDTWPCWKEVEAK